VPSQFESQLVREIRQNSRRAFDEAVRTVGTEFSTASGTPGPDGVPLDTGFLRSRYRQSNRSVSSDVLRTTVSVMATNAGTDYGAILENAKRIAPKKAKFLKFTPPGATGPVFSKGFDNRWYQWWSNWWGGLDDNSKRWVDAVSASLERSFNR